jgi:hypothetical protein
MNTRRRTEFSIGSEIGCVQSQCVKQGGLRQRVVGVGSAAEDLDQGPERRLDGREAII